MSTITQHRPAYYTGFDNAVATFTTTEELLAIPFVAAFREPDGFHRYSLSREPRTMLMAEYDAGKKWWVVGYIDGEPPELPPWQATK